jgi:DNA polymerase-1
MGTRRLIPVAFDLETHPIRPGALAPVPVVVSVATAEGVRLSLNWKATVGALLADRRVLLIGHNVAFDLAAVYQHAPELRTLIWQAYDAGRVSDTGLRDRILLLAEGRRSFDHSATWQSPPAQPGTMRPVFSLAEAVARNLPDADAFAWWRDDKSAKHDGADGELFPQAPAGSGWRLRYAELERVALADWPADAIAYAETDALLTLRVWQAQGQRAPSYRDGTVPDALRNEPDQVRAAWALHLVSAWGMVTDAETVEGFSRQWSALSDRILHRLADSGILRGGRKNMAAIQSRVVAAAAAAGRTVPRTDSGKVSTEREVLEDSGDPALALLAEQTKLEKLICTYLPVLRAGTAAPLHTRYEALLETGRTSSSRPNVQNLPRDLFVRDPDSGDKVPLTVREAFVPREGRAFVSVDYDTLELRTLAQVTHQLTAGKSNLATVLNSGLDPHLDLAALMLGIPYDEAHRRLKAGDAQVKQTRTAAKPANFGYPGGLGADAFADYARAYTGGALRMTSEQARAQKAYWIKKWPEMRAYFNSIEGMRQGSAYSVRMPGSELLRKGCTFTAACNCPFQALAAHGAKRALYRTVRACYGEPESPLYGSRAVAFIHDEIIIEAPTERLHEAGAELSRIMVETMQVDVPDVRITATPAAMRRWFKGAEPVFVDGRLIPWEPKGA